MATEDDKPKPIEPVIDPAVHKSYKRSASVIWAVMFVQAANIGEGLVRGFDPFDGLNLSCSR